MPRISGAQDFEAFLDQSVAADARLGPAAKVLREIAATAVEMSELIGLGQLYGRLGASRASTNTDGDVQKELDVLANDMFIEAFRRAPVLGVVSEELSEPLAARSDSAACRRDRSARRLLEHRRQCVDRHDLLDPPRAARRQHAYDAHFLQPGRAQIAAGFVIYGPQTSIVFALGADATEIFTLDRGDGASTRRSRSQISRGTRPNMRSTPRTTGIGSLRSGPISTIACKASTGR